MQRGRGARTGPSSKCSPNPQHLENSPAIRHRKSKEGETDPGHRDRGYLLGRNIFCSLMPCTSCCRVSELSRCPEQGARRGAEALHGVRTLLRSRIARAQPAQPRWARVCTRAGKLDLPSLNPSFSRFELSGVGGFPWPLLALAPCPPRPKRSGRLTPGVLIPERLNEFFPTFNSWA